jgi:hypothetical protein
MLLLRSRLVLSLLVVLRALLLFLALAVPLLALSLLAVLVLGGRRLLVGGLLRLAPILMTIRVASVLLLTGWRRRSSRALVLISVPLLVVLIVVLLAVIVSVIELVLLRATISLLLVLAATSTAITTTAHVAMTPAVTTLAFTITTTPSEGTTSTPKASSVASATTKVAASTSSSSSSEATASVAPWTPASSHAPSHMAAVFKWRALTNDLLEMVRSGERLVHAHVIIFVVAVLETAAGVLHRPINRRCGRVHV